MKIQLLFLCLILLVVFILKYTKKRTGYKILISEMFWIFLPWAISLILYFFGGIEYRFKLNFNVILYISLFWCSFFAGRKLARWKVKEREVTENYEKIDVLRKKINLRPFFWISLISVLLYLFIILFNNDITIGVTRIISSNVMLTLLILLSNVSIIVWLNELSYSLLNDVKIPIYGYLSVIIYTIPGLLISGRDSLMILIIATAITFFYCGNMGVKQLKNSGKIFRKMKIILFVLMLLVLLYFIFLSNNRYGKGMITLFEWSVDCVFSKELLSFSESLGNLGVLLLNAIYYYSSQFSKLAFVFTNYNGPYLGGMFQLHYISRRFPDSWNLDYTRVTEAAYSLMSRFDVSGLHSIWDTVIGYFIYDFGRVWAIIIVFVFGYIIGKMRNKFDKEKNYINIITQIMLCVGMFITVEFSPIFNTNWVFSIFWLWFIRHFYLKKKA